MQHLQREVEALRDQLVYQNELAEASAAKIRQLEYEKEVHTGAFDGRSNELGGQLAEARLELEATRKEMSEWRQRAEAAEARVEELTSSHASLDRTINDERATTMKLLRDYQSKESENTVRNIKFFTYVTYVTYVFTTMIPSAIWSKFRNVTLSSSQRSCASANN